MNTHELPPGKYFIGDVSYFLTDEYYESVKENLFDYTKQITGFMTLMKTQRGSWVGSNKELYYVSSGVLGICSFDIGEDMGAGSVHNFKDKIYVDTNVEGVLKVSSGKTTIVIDTRCEPMDDEDDYGGYDSCG